MNQDFQNTVLLWEHTRDNGSGGEDTFEPDVKVLLSWKDVEAAVAVGAVVPTEAYALWAYWAAPGSPARLAAQAVLASKPEPADTSASIAAAASEPGASAAVPTSSWGDASDDLLAMHKPGQPKQGDGLPYELRVVLLVVAVALVVWVAGKGMSLW
jgi:hypothetical protein